MKKASKPDKGKNKAASKGKKISIRKHLPLFVRIHYDTVKNFSPSKLFGIGVMAFIAVFGVLLATQTISPTTSAVLDQSSSNDVQVTNFSSASDKARFIVRVAGQQRIKNVKYYESRLPSDSGIGCTRDIDDYDDFAIVGTVPYNVSDYVIEDISTSAKRLCIVVSYTFELYFPPTQSTRTTDAYTFQGPFPVNVDNEESSTTSTGTSTSTIQTPQSVTNYKDIHTSVPRNRFKQTSRTQVSFDASVTTANLTLLDVKYYTTTVLSQQNIPATCATMPTRYTRPASSSRSGPSSYTKGYTASVGSKDKGICIMISFKRVGSEETMYGFHDSSPFRINGDYKFEIKSVSQEGLNYVFEAGRDAMWSHKYSTMPTGSSLEEQRRSASYGCDGHFVVAVNYSRDYEVLLEGLSAGRYVLCIEASDGRGNYASKVVNIQVSDGSTETTPVTTTPVKTETTPVKPETTPVKTETTPVKPETTPVKPEVEETETVTREPEEATAIADTGILDDENSWSQLGGYILIAGAALGTARILVVKKYKQIG